MKHRFCPLPQPLSQAWERGARAEGSGGVRVNHTRIQQRPILLAHEPDSADTNAATGKFDLQLSGHAHGGQVRLLGIHFFPKRGRIYPIGQYQVKEMIQYTSRGIGAVPPRGRLNCRPEITVLTLRSPVVTEDHGLNKI